MRRLLQIDPQWTNLPFDQGRGLLSRGLALTIDGVSQIPLPKPASEFEVFGVDEGGGGKFIVVYAARRRLDPRRKNAHFCHRRYELVRL